MTSNAPTVAPMLKPISMLNILRTLTSLFGHYLQDYRVDTDENSVLEMVASIIYY